MAGTGRSGGRWRVLAVVALAAAASPVAMGSTAIAHGADGAMQLEATVSAPLQALVRATVIYEHDRDLALGASVVVEGSGPGGQALSPVPLAEVGDGRYEATVTFPTPGAWTVRALATDPAANGEATVLIAEAAASVTTTTVPDVEIAESRRARASTEDDDSGLVLPLVVIALIGLGAAVTPWALQRRRRRST